jgi:hypothetical protein
MEHVRNIGRVLAVVLVAATACSARARSSVVTGYIAPCTGALRAPEPHAAGTVTALRGTTKLVHVSPDQLREILPHQVAAKTHTDGIKPFRLRLAPGDYVLVAAYDDFPTTTTAPVTLTVPPSRTTLERDLPSSCK